MDANLPTTDLATPIGNCTLGCYLKESHEYFCTFCDQEFSHEGIPSECPHCGSLEITAGDDIIDAYIRQAQKVPA